MWKLALIIAGKRVAVIAGGYQRAAGGITVQQSK